MAVKEQQARSRERTQVQQAAISCLDGTASSHFLPGWYSKQPYLACMVQQAAISFLDEALLYRI